MASDDNDMISTLGSYLEKLHVSKEELNKPAWQQILQNGALPRECVTTAEPSQRASQDDVNEPEECISDKKDNDVQTTHELELRDYQRELARDALTGHNTIICAPTGSGKTRVATFIIHKHLEQVEDGAGDKRKAAFLARTVPLAIQQYKVFQKHLKEYKVVNVTGQSGNSMKLHLLCPSSDLIVMTPMILVNALTRKTLPDLNVFSLLVFDECHHTNKGEPYNQLMFIYHKMKWADGVTKLPQIVGLSASIGTNNDKAPTLDKAKTSALKICANLDAHKLSVVEENINSLRQIVPKPTENTKRLTERDNKGFVEKVTSVMGKLESDIKEHTTALNLNDLIKGIPKDKKTQKYRQWTTKLRKAALEVHILNENKDAYTAHARPIIFITHYLEKYSVALEMYDLVDLKEVIVSLEKRFEKFKADEETTDAESAFYKYFTELRAFATGRQEENPNLQLLREILMASLVSKSDKSRGIIFVKTRVLAEAVASWLNRCNIPEVENLNATIFTSANVAKDEGGMSQEEQDAAIQDFRTGHVRLLVATSVGEEGLDIPECNLVVKYNYAGNEISSIQTRGRSRSFGGESILLAMDSILTKEAENNEKEKIMERAITCIRGMAQSEFSSTVQRHQNDAYTESQRAEQAEAEHKRNLKKDSFKMICSGCRKVGVNSSYLRVVNGSCRISLDRNFLEDIKIIPDTQEFHDETEYVATVYCMGEPQPGKHCKKVLGKLIRHARNPIVALAVRSFGFETQVGRPIFYKQWKLVPYLIEELDADDINRYNAITASGLMRQDDNPTFSHVPQLKPGQAKELKREQTTISDHEEVKRQKMDVEDACTLKLAVSVPVPPNSDIHASSDSDELIEQMDMLDENLKSLQKEVSTQKS